MTFGTFLTPDRDLETLAEPNLKLGIRTFTGARALDDVRQFRGQNRIFDAIIDRLDAVELTCEDQCTAQYYFDIVRTLRDFHGEFSRVVEVGVYMGGSTSVLAGCIEPFGCDLDLVDTSDVYLRYAYERARRMYPHLAHRIRMFHGDLPSYVRHVMMEERPQQTIVHHDGAHAFNQVVMDMASLSYVREQLCAIITQDTHLRGSPKHMNFVDMALYAVFGLDLNYAPIGAVHEFMTMPDNFFGNYVRAGVPEGFVLPMSVNEFVYPHQFANMDDFLPARQANQRAAA
ncbi:class I SAM-dependent methyltransferase [Sphingobium nicotianae]|uniref:Class I SAM-dependent methyltransferase n=1 Tax=Sphingobium nicotianae TaxID=2782607 RepID=A0A9X1IRN5_9SPHN|nr:class I SAM-dependent methyltransferase [Sphingobium nicotianae]MBT2187651.1 class I SAM-dependent methyltransferase [Sphingobium nicotianae]